MKIAIIGTGISGLGAAYLLAPEHDITIYEKNAYIGGHSRTIEINLDKKLVPVDTGFIVFNNWNYPHLMGLFNHLKVPYTKSDMSFGVSIDNGWLEYSSEALFKRKNTARGQYWKMLGDIMRFNKQAPRYIKTNPDATLRQCLSDLKMGEWFRQYYLLAMGAAIWSCPLDTILKFPARVFIQFFKNHGLLNIIRRPQWYTVTGGSKEYVSRLTAAIKDRIRLNCGVEKVVKTTQGWGVHDQTGQIENYDQIVFACHADETLSMIENPAPDIQDVIGSFSYQNNKIIVHSDESFMPADKKCWSSWVYLSDTQEDQKTNVALSYWMNNLQPLNTKTPVLVTLNPERLPDKTKIYDEHVFSHPIFDTKAIHAQSKIKDIQGKNGLWFCGAYQRYGFHEDGLLSAVNVAKSLGVHIPWE